MFIYTKPHNIDASIHGRRIINLLQIAQIVIVAQSSGQGAIFIVKGDGNTSIARKATLEEAQAVVDRIFKAITDGKAFLDLNDEETTT